MLKTARLEEMLINVMRERALNYWDESSEWDLDELTDKLLSPDQEGYAWEWAGIIGELIVKLTGKKVVCYPLAEGWDILLTLDKKVLGILTPSQAPYLDFERCLETVEETINQALKLFKEEQNERN